MMNKSLKQVGNLFKKVRKPIDKITGKARNNELIGYFKMFETILSGLDSSITNQQKQIDNLERKINKHSKEKQEKKQRSDKLAKVMIFVALLLSIINIFILFFVFNKGLI